MQPGQENNPLNAAGPSDAAPVSQGAPIQVNIISAAPPETSLEAEGETTENAVNPANIGLSPPNLSPTNPFASNMAMPKSEAPSAPKLSLWRNKMFMRAIGGLTAVILLVGGASIFTGGQPPVSHRNTSKLPSGILSSISAAPSDTSSESININRNTTIGAKNSFTALGVARFQSVFNSPTAFVIQNADGSNLFAADTQHNKVQVNGNIVASGNIEADNGAVSLSATGLKIGGVVICTSDGCLPGLNGSGAGGQNKAVCALGLCVSLQTNSPGSPEPGSINISGSVTARAFAGNGAQLSNVNALTLQGLPASYFTDATHITAGTVADSRLSSNVSLLNANQTFSGTNTFSGPILVQNSTDSNQVFSVQTAGGVSLLNVDSLNGEVALGTANEKTGSLAFYASTNNHKITLFGLDGPANDQNIYLPNDSGTICLTSGNCTGTGGYGDVLQGGNSFGTAMLLGTNDNFGLSLETNGAVAQAISNSGSVLFKSTADSASNFQVQTSNGQNLLNLDGTTGQLTLGALGGSGATSIVFSGTSATNTVTLQAPAGPSANQTITLPDSSGIVCLTSGNCVGLGGYGDINQGGDSFSTNISIGTNDNYGLNFKTDSNVVQSFTNTGAVTFQNSVDSNKAFQVQNLAGTSNLLVADTQDTRIGIANGAPTATLSINGSGLIQQGSATSLTVSGNEITDASRTANAQGDGRAAPDSSYDVWEGTTNLVTNGGFESNTTGWVANIGTETLSRDTTVSKFGAASLKISVVASTPNQGVIINPRITATASTTYTFSGWVKGTAGLTFFPQVGYFNGATNLSYASGGATTFSGSWQKVALTFTTPASTNFIQIMYLASGSSAQTFWVDGVQVEQKAYATPYVETNGATATRAAARVQAPAINLNATQGWTAFRVRMGFSSTQPRNIRWLEWQDDTNNRLIFILTSANQFGFYRQSGGVGSSVNTATQSFNAGDVLTIIAKWDSGHVQLSVNGSSFVSNNNTNIPSLAATTFDIGSDAGVTQFADSDILWSATGTGTLSNTDASNINNFGNTDPSLNSFNGTAANPTMVWQANSASYLTGSNQAALLIQNSAGANALTVDANASKLTINTNNTLIQPIVDNTTAFQIQNASGTNNLFTADTSNGRIAINGSNSTASFNITGSQIIQQGAATALTTSGNEITDINRSANIQGDGKTPPDSSYGVWEATTNLVKNGGLETDISNIGQNKGVVSRDNTISRFGSASAKIVADGTGVGGIYPTYASGGNPGSRVPVSANQTYTASVWVYSASAMSFRPSIEWYDNTNTMITDSAGNIQTTVAGTWTRINVTATAPSNAIGATPTMYTTNTPVNGTTWWNDGLQFEQKTIATPYVETNGATAIRQSARVQAPVAGNLSATQGWVAMRIRMGASPASLSSYGSNPPRLWSWGNGYQDFQVYPNTSYDGSMSISRNSGRTGGAQATSASGAWSSAGDIVTVVAAWDANAVYISINGGAFVKNAGNGIPPSLPVLFDIGTLQGQTPLDGDVLWAATGTGTLTNSDATNINAFGNIDPSVTKFNSTATPTMVWQANNANYYTSSNQALAFQVQNSAGTSLVSVDATNSKLNVNTAGLFQNTANSSNAFSVNTDVGSTLFNVNTSNLQVTANNLQSSGAVNLTTSNGTVSLAGSLQSASSLTTSGNEITDAARAVGASTINTSGQTYDGKTNDSSYGIWEGTTNLIKNGGAETDLSSTFSDGGGTTTRTRDTGTSKFGSASFKAVTDGTAANQGYGWWDTSGTNSRIAISSSTSYTASAWVKGNSGGEALRIAITWYDNTGSAISTPSTSFTATTSWVRYVFTGTSPSNATEVAVKISTSGTSAVTFWVDGAQLEQKAYATPYVETNGAIATRNAARVQAPATVLNTSQSWVAMRLRPSYASSIGSSTNSRFFWFGPDGSGNNRISAQYNNVGNAVSLISNGGSTSDTAGTSATWNAGDTITVIAAWTSTGLQLSFNGGAFVTAPRTQIPSGSFIFDLGSQFGSQGYFDGDILWTATGTGTLSNTDAANLNNLGNTDPTLANLYSLNSGAAQPTLVWNANTANYQDTTTSNGQALIYAANTTGATTGNLLDLQSGTYPSSKFSVDVNGNTSIAGNLSLQGQALQKITNTAAFQIQSANGVSALAVDTLNGRVGINTTSPTANLQVNGQGLFQATTATTTLTESGNEITDATRTANAQGDGRTAPDSSTGTWEGTTNLVTNGGFESNVNSWITSNGPSESSTFTRTTADSKFGSAASDFAVTTGNGSYRLLLGNVPNFTVGASYTLSFWAKSVSGTTDWRVGIMNQNGSNVVMSLQQLNPNSTWQRFTYTFTPTIVGSAPQIYITPGSSIFTGTVRLDGMQLEQKSIATPYVETNGSTASRNPARVQAPASVVNAAQGWAAFRLNMGFASTQTASVISQYGENLRLFQWQDSGTTRLLLVMDASNHLDMQRQINGVGNSAISAPQTFNAGDTMTVVAKWDANNLYISVNGGIFTSVSNNSIPSLAATTFDIGTDTSAGFLDSNILWGATGQGVLSNTDAANINALGNTDPSLSSFANTAGTTFVWQGNNSTSLNSANQSTPLQVNNASGASLFNINATNSQLTSAANSNLFQNTADSSSTFAIQNAAGNSNLFIADTINSRIGIGTATPTATLSVNGSGLIQQSNTTNPLLSVSGNEITDASRAVNTQGDGRAAPDSSYSIWEGTTNLITNGGFESNIVGWGQATSGETLTRDTTTPEFGTASLRIDTGASNGSGASITQSGWPIVTSGQVYTGSAWVKGVAGRTLKVLLMARDEGNGNNILGNSTGTAVATGSWQRITSTITIPSGGTGPVGLYMAVEDSVLGGNTSFWVDGAQIEQKAYATPYVETNGATATRAAASVSTSNSGLNGSQGWYAARIKTGFASSGSVTGFGLGELNNGSGGRVTLSYSQATGFFSLARVGGGNNTLNSSAQSFAAESVHTVIAAWTGTQLELSVDGGAFTSMADTNIPTGSFTLYLGSRAGNTALDGDMLWTATGMGTLSNTDASNINAFGSADPSYTSFPGSASPTMVWQANNASYQNSAASSALTFNVQNSSGTNLFGIDANAGQVTANTTALFKNSLNTTGAFQVQNASGTNVLAVDTANSLVSLGTLGASGVNGAITFNSTNAGGYGVTLAASANQTASYVIKLPTNAPSQGQCLAADSVDATQLDFVGCGSGGGSGTLQDAYNNSTTPASITTTSATKGIIAKAGGGFDSTTLLQVQNSSGNDILDIDSTNSRVGIGTNAPTAALDVRGDITTGSYNKFIGYVGTTDIQYGADLAIRTAGTTQATIKSGGSTTFKNSTDSTTAFQIQNAAGTSNLVVADTADSRLGIGTATPVATLNVNGSTLIQQGTATNLTVSGNEITDTTRTTNTQGDGRQAPDSSEGIWEGTTNLVTNGGLESNTTGWNGYQGTETITRDTSQSRFGSASVKISTPGNALEGTYQDTASGQAANTAFTASAWVRAPSGVSMRIIARDTINNVNSPTTTFTGTGNWQRVSATVTTGASTTQLRIIITTNANILTAFWVDGAQYEQKSIATPYVETNGATASRSASRVQIPSSVLNTSQGWTAMRLRMDFSSASAPSASFGLFDWRNDSNNRYTIFWNQSTAAWNLISVNGGAGSLASIPGTFNSGDYITVATYWTNGGVAISVNGSTFTTSSTGTRPAVTAATADIGAISGGSQIDSDILWTAAGNGILTNTDATNLNNFGNTDPAFNQLPAGGIPTFLWKANNANYNTSTNSDVVFQANNNSGSSLLSLDATNSKLSVNTQGLFQNTTNSSNAFTVNTSSGTQLFNVNTSNLQVSASNLQSSGAVNLINSNGTVSLAGSLQSTNTLTTSGNEITDATRTTNTQGDGRTPPDSSYGIWESTTNLVTNGGFESNTNGWAGTNSATFSRDNSAAKFGANSLKVVTPGTITGEGAWDSTVGGVFTVSPSTVYTLSEWVKAPAGSVLQAVIDEHSSGSHLQYDYSSNAVGTGVWQRIVTTFTTSSTTNQVGVGITTAGTAQAITFWLDGVQLEQKTYATPYAETNGAAASRSPARVQAPATGMNSTQGWVATNLRMEYASGILPSSSLRLFDWQNDGNNRITLVLNPNSGNIQMTRWSGGVSNVANFSTSWSQGATLSVVATWTANSVGISVNGSAFVTAIGNNIPTMTAATFDIGNSLGGSQIDSSILWTATGTGTLSNTDAANLNNLGNTDPTLANLYSLNSGAAQPTLVWNANTANYQDTTTSNGQALIYAANTTGATTGNLLDLQSGTYPSSKFSVDVGGNLKDVGRATFQNSTDSTTAFQIQNAAGTSNLLVADTANSRVGIGTSTPTATLSVNGSGLIQQSTITSPLLTTSGNEITDATRTINTQGDGRATPDSSYGIWEPTTNLILNGGTESNTISVGGALGSGETITRDTTTAKFGNASAKTIIDGSVPNQGVAYSGNTGLNATAGTTFAYSIWVKPANGVTLRMFSRINNTDSTVTDSAGTNTITGNGTTWYRMTETVTVASGKTGDSIKIGIRTVIGASLATTFWTDGAQVEQKAFATPYVETNGATASRSQGEVQPLIGPMNTVQGWMAMRVRLGFPSTVTPSAPTIFGSIAIDANNRLQIVWTGGFWQTRRIAGGVGGANVSVADTFSIGDTRTIIVSWTASTISLSINGANFTSVSNSNTFKPTNFDIGSQGTGSEADSDFLWFGDGTGTLTNTDATNINALNNTDPGFASFAGSASPAMTWAANNASYANSSASSSLVFNVQNSTGTNLFGVDASAGQVTANTSALFKNNVNSAAALQVQNAGGNNLLSVDTVNNSVNLGTPGASGVNGQVVFNSATSGGYGVTLGVSSAQTQSYSLKLPTAAPSQGQCLVVDGTDATQLDFSSCGAGGGGGDLQGAYNGSASPAIIATTSATKGIIFKGGAGNDSATLFQVQNSSGLSILDVDTINSRVGIGTNTPGAKLDISSGSGVAVKVNSTSTSDILDLASSSTNVFTVNSSGSVLAKNSTDSTTAFQIQNAAGTSNLVVADTADSRLGIGTATPVATLNVNGSTLIQQGTATNLTVSGNEITDTTRTTNTQGDGRQAPDSSEGIWEGTTNLVTNGGLESNTTGWFIGNGTATLSRDNTIAKFGSSSLLMATSVAGSTSAAYDYTPGGTLSQQAFTASEWIKGPAGQTAHLVLWEMGGAAGSANSDSGNVTYTGGWQRISVTRTIVQPDRTKMRLELYNNAATASQQNWIDGVQLEQKTVATPYVETNGATASHSAGQVKAPPSSLSPIQGWVAMRMRMGFGTSALPNQTQEPFFALSDGTSNNRITGMLINSTGNLEIASVSGGTGSFSHLAAAPTWNQGDTKTFIFAWTSTTELISIDGGTFSTIVSSRPNIPISISQLEFGSYAGSSTQIDSDIMWTATGTGTLTNTDASNLNAFGNIDPNISSFAGTADPTMVWKANTSAYNTSSNSDLAFSIQNNSGSNLLSVNATNSKLTVNTAGLIQTNSTSALAVNTSSGQNLFNVNTSNLQVSASNLQSSGAVNLINSNGTVSLAGSLQSTNTLTTSGNEITDATRTTNTQGDGRTPPDSSYGIWESTTNLVTNGGFESNTTGWFTTSAVRVQDSSFVKFGSHSLKVTTSNLQGNEGVYYSSAPAIAGNAYTVSSWVYSTTGATIYSGRIEWKDSGGSTITSSNGSPVSIPQNQWTRLTFTATAPANTVSMVPTWYTNTQQASTFWIDGVQLEQKAYATPYVETNGATATRSTGDIQAPLANTGLTSTQGWVAARVRMGIASSVTPASPPAVFTLSDGTLNNKIGLYAISGQWQTRRTVGGVTGNFNTITDSWNVGDYRTVVVSWNTTTISLSINGATFISTANAGLFTPAMFEIGNHSIGGQPFDGDILWTATGTGTLSNADASNLNIYSNIDPTLARLYSLNSGAGQPTFVWNANNANYQDVTSSNGQALIYAANTSGVTSGDLIDLQSGPNSSSKFNVDVNGNTNIAGQLTVNSKGLFQNSSDSTNAFQILNASGSNALLTADTTNGRLGVGTSAPTATLNVNGSALIQQNASAGTLLSVSGNEITDASRTAGTQGDGRAAPDSSYGIWESTTNLITNGGFETNTAGWSQNGSYTLTRSTSVSRFGTASLQTTYTTGADSNAGFENYAVTNGQAYTDSAWVYIPSSWDGGTVRVSAEGNVSSTVGSANMSLRDQWQRISTTAIATASGTSALVIRPSSLPSVGKFLYIDGAQAEDKPIATPYVETNGATATRNAGNTQGQAALLNTTQGWVAMRVRMGFASTQTSSIISNDDGGNLIRLFAWSTDTNNRILLTLSASNTFQLLRVQGGSGNTSASSVQTFNAGDYLTVIASWDAGHTYVSVNGSNFASVSNSSIPTITNNFFIGGDGNIDQMNSDNMWFAAGTGTLNNTDASSINGFGNTDPNVTNFANTTTPTMAWAANTSSFNNSSNQPIVFQVQNSLGGNLINVDASAVAINIGGALNVSGATALSSTLNVGGDTQLQSTLEVSGLTTLSGALTVTGDVNTTGQYQINGSQIASANLADSSNIAKLNGTGPQAFTGDNQFSGSTLFKNAADSPTSLVIQNANSTTNLFTADTTDGRIGIATSSTPGSTLDVGGDINTSGNYLINGIQISTADLSDANTLAFLSVNNTLTGNNTFTGNLLDKPATDGVNVFQVQNSGGGILLAADTSNMRVYVGNPAGSSMASLLVLSNQTTATDPTGTNGAIYYNSSLGKFRCYENGAWSNCVYGAQTTVKTASQTFSGTSYANVNDMGYAVGANKNYTLQCSLLMSVSGNGGNISMNGPAGPANYTATFMKASDQSAGDQFTTSNSFDDPNSSSAFLISTTTTGSNKFLLSYTAVLSNGSSAGTWQLRAKAASGGTITLYPVSSCDLRPF